MIKLKITDVRVKKVEGQSRLKAIASITIEGVFVVHELRVIQGEGGVFVAMPSKKNKQGEFKDLAHPIDTEVRREIERIVIEAYNNAE